jgi:hypothetical protein
VKVIEALGYSFDGLEWSAPVYGAPLPNLHDEADAMHALLVLRADKLEEGIKGDDDEAELKMLGEVVGDYEAKRWPDGVVPRAKDWPGLDKKDLLQAAWQLSTAYQRKGSWPPKFIKLKDEDGAEFAVNVEMITKIIPPTDDDELIELYLIDEEDALEVQDSMDGGIGEGEGEKLGLPPHPVSMRLEPTSSAFHRIGCILARGIVSNGFSVSNAVRSQER